VRQSDLKLIRALPLFCDMSDASFEELARSASLQRFPQHMVLITEGDMPEFLHIVVDGSVEMFGTHDGYETTIDIIRPVTTILLAAVIRDAVYLKSARTLAPAQILVIPAQTVRDVFGRDAAFARAIVNELAERYDLPGTYAAICFVILVSVIFFIITERAERWLRPVN